MSADGRRRDGRDLRQALIDAASAMLQEAQPTPAPSLRAVARACGVSPTAVYLHFDSWAALIDAVLQQHFADARARVESALRGVEGPRERLDAFALVYVTWGLEHQGPYQLLFGSMEWLKETDEVSAWLEGCVDSMAGDLLAVGAADDRADALKRVEWLWVALDGLISLRRRKGRYPAHRSVAEDVAGMVEVFAGPAAGGPGAG
ncbi:TetR/AcrR family transcriptional regulator [Actinorugispora endophytica]|uniref:TetR family transcriptional regulator n=1 Tax=Actinorugispora endophytica TaxID=1605990 RepID=A0A4R6V2R1_9ACTN|nr:TetR/AcrR family transcriptional regulator [Actinorugispora endophytica]TDQ54263.1 TetR family transcriptional regulator [Actinorugispora endophytica]